MSRIEELIAQYCPHGVEFIELQELFDTRNGYTPSRSNKTFWENGIVPWFRMDDIRENGGILSKSIEYVSMEAVKGGNLFPAGSIIVATSATIGVHALIEVPFLCNQRFTTLQIKNKYQDRLIAKFIYYYCFLLDEWCMNNTTKSSFASVDMRKFQHFKFPVPPLQIQEEIVRILDSFTQLEAELEAELEARRKQYEYYRDSLLDSNNRNKHIDIRVVPLGELCEITRGASPRPISKFITSDIENAVPWIKIGDVEALGKYVTQTAQFITIEGAAKSREVRPGDFLLSNSMSFGRPYISKINGCIHDGWLNITNFKRAFLPDYLYHLLRSAKIQHQFESSVGSSTVSNLNSQIVARTVVEVPPLEEQERIVGILDKFDALVNDLTSGLPAEIAARRKQYEYYRDKLLSFKELEK